MDTPTSLSVGGQQMGSNFAVAVASSDDLDTKAKEVLLLSSRDIYAT